LVVVAAKNDIRGQALKITEVDITDIGSLSLPGVKKSRSPPPVSEFLLLGACNAQSNEAGAAQGGDISKCPVNHRQFQQLVKHPQVHPVAHIEHAKRNHYLMTLKSTIPIDM